MTLVIMCLSLNLSRAKLQFRLGPIKSLNLGLFVNRQNQCIIWRVHIQPDNITHFLSEVGSLLILTAAASNLLLSGSDSLASVSPRQLRHETDTSMCGLFWQFMDRVIQYLFDSFAIQFSWLTGSRPIIS